MIDLPYVLQYNIEKTMWPPEFNFGLNPNTFKTFKKIVKQFLSRAEIASKLTTFPHFCDAPNDLCIHPAVICPRGHLVLFINIVLYFGRKIGFLIIS